MGTLGVQEMIAIFLVALVLFGPKKLPELGRTIGKAITEFRRASSDLKATFEREMQSLERESESIKDVTHQIASDIQSHTNFDDYPYYDSGSYGTDSYDSTATNPSTVGALEGPSAESHGAIEAAQHVEGTVPRIEAAPHTDHTVIDVAVNHVDHVETPVSEPSQHKS
jgi:sec-independent protein translocase protein TatA